ncbi:MAG: adenylosuccinate lyase [Deltaproteobacteria bacterium]|nr:adenylosuccinate lyase [Deltaproteobacteria bacterium]
MIPRYSRKDMAQLWSEQAKYDLWLQVELAVTRALVKRGEVPAEALKTLETKAGYDLERIAAIEEEVKHDVIAFLTSVTEHVGSDARFLHFGMTSSDLLDTAFSCQLKKAGELIANDLQLLKAALKKQAFAHKMTPMIGRSHGMHAEPTTFGLKCALWFDEFGRHQKRLALALEDIAVGKISGAVGTFAHLSPDIEAEVCAALGLKADPISTQVVQRDRHAFFFSVLAGIASSIEKIAVEIRHLQRTEVFEVAEPFGKGQKGSSAMPHKRNPILSENVTGLARLVRSYADAALQNVALWHERDISHSSVERVIAPDATILTDFMLHRMAGLIDRLDVFADRMAENLESSRGLYASQTLLLALIRKGLSREEAYKMIQDSAMKSWNEKKHFCDLVAANPDIKSRLSAEELDRAFDLTEHLKHVGAIFERVFGKS